MGCTLAAVVRRELYLVALLARFLLRVEHVQERSEKLSNLKSSKAISTSERSAPRLHCKFNVSIFNELAASTWLTVRIRIERMSFASSSVLQYSSPLS